MTNDKKAERFIMILTGFLGLSLVITYNDALSAGRPSAMFGLLFGVLLDGGLCWLLLKRKRFARLILGILLMLPPVLTFTLSISHSENIESNILLRHAIIGLFGVCLLAWRPIRDYTKQKLNHSPEPTPGVVH